MKNAKNVPQTDTNTNINPENEQNITNQQLMTPIGMYPPGMMPGMMTPGMGPPMMPMPGMMDPQMNQGMMPGMMPGMMGYGPQAFAYIEDPIAELAQCTGAILRQELEMYEIISGCETQNRYHVFLQSSMGIKYAFKCIERSGCCGRVCCCNDCRSIKVDIRHVKSANEDPDLATLFISAKKPCALNCCCFCRPQLNISLAKNNSYLGKIREPCTCCNIETEVYDKNKSLKYRIIGSCCQYGLCCGSSAEKIAEIQFKITKHGQTVGIMKKLTSSMGEYFSKADSYKISFPLDATPEDKILLICAGLLIDYQNFESNDTPKQNRAKAGV